MNLYGYAAGDPVNNSDPFGLCPPENTDISDCTGEEGNAEAEAAYAKRVLASYAVCEADLRQAGMAIVSFVAGVGILDRLGSSVGVARGMAGKNPAPGAAALSSGLDMSSNEATLALNAMALPAVMATAHSADQRSPGTKGPGGFLGGLYRVSQLWGPLEVVGQAVEAGVSCRRAVNDG